MSRLSKILFRDIHEGAPDRVAEGRSLSGLFFCLTASAYIFKAVKISLFLKWLQASRLPFAYLITAVVMGLVVTLNTRLLRTMNRRPYVLGSLIFFTATLVLFRLALPGHGRWLIILYWLWSDIFLAMSVTQFWIVVGDVFPPREAKRMVSPLVKAGLLGGIFGSFLASRLAAPLGSEDLLLVGLAFLVAAIFLAGAVLRRPSKAAVPQAPPASGEPAAPAAAPCAPAAPAPAAGRVGYRKSFKALLENRYLLLISGAALAAVTVSTLLDFQFSRVLEWKITGADERTAFLGTFFTALLIVSLVLQSTLTHRVLRAFGLRTAVMVTPAVLLLGVVAVAVVPAALALPWAVAVKGADKSLTHTFSQSTREILYMPIPSETRAKAKVFIDMFLNKAGDGIAALLIAGVTAVFSPSWKGMSWATGACLGIWVLLTIGINRSYGEVVKGNLRARRRDADEIITEHVDVDAAKLVFDTLDSRRRSSVLYAMNLMDLVRREGLSPELRAILNEETSRVQAGSLDGLIGTGGSTLFPGWDDRLAEESLDEQVREVLSLDVYQEIMKRRFDDIGRKPGPSGVVEQMEAAKSIGLMAPDSPLVDRLRTLLRHESPDVVRYALESASRHLRREHVPLILPHLGDPAIADAAAASLAAYGDRISGALGDALLDASLAAAARKAVPGVLARTATPRAAAVLVRALRRRDPEVLAEIVQALVKMRAENPALGFPEPAVAAEVRRAVDAACDQLECRARGQAGPAGEMGDAALERAFKRVFDLLSLVYPFEDVVRAWQNFARGERRTVDYSIDLLEHMLRREDKDVVLPLLEQGPDEAKAKRCRELRRRLTGEA
jgi:ATP:ADP antiporter, AAA family